jgi:hypothetical protein
VDKRKSELIHAEQETIMKGCLFRRSGIVIWKNVQFGGAADTAWFMIVENFSLGRDFMLVFGWFYICFIYFFDGLVLTEMITHWRSVAADCSTHHHINWIRLLVFMLLYTCYLH